MEKKLNISKLIYKAIGQGFEGDPTTSSLLNIQDWVIRTYDLIPTISWDTTKKCWNAYVYDYNYDAKTYIAKIKSEKGVDTKTATGMLDRYIKSHYVVKDTNGNQVFYDSETALYFAIEFALSKVFN